MLQIRLNKSAPADAGGGAEKSSLPAETVTVACPDHLVLADLPVAKSLGAVTASAAPSVRSVARRSRRILGQKVHLCVRCDFPIAIYGRLTPCEHTFCLACARSDSICYLCDERIQKIQTIKMMEGIFVCAAPHCLKSFLKRDEFESHVSDTHDDLLHPDMEREGGNETESLKLSSADPHKQSLQPELSTVPAPPRSGVSPSSISQLQDREERPRRHQSRDQPPARPPLQPRPSPHQSRHQLQPGDPQTESNTPQGLEKPYNLFHQLQSTENQSISQQRRDSDQLAPNRQAGIPQESSLPNYPPPLPPQPPNYALPVNANQVLAPVPTSIYPFPTDGSQPYYTAPYEMPRPESMSEGGSEQVSVLGIPPAPTAVSGFPDNFPRPWGMSFMGMPFTPMQVGQGIPEGFANPTDAQGRLQFSQADYARIPEGLLINPPLPGKEPEQQGGSADQEVNGMLTPLQLPQLFPHGLPPPPPLPRPMLQQTNTGNFSAQEGQAYGWQNDNRRFANAPE